MSVDNVSRTGSVYRLPGPLGRFVGDIVVHWADEKDEVEPSDDGADSAADGAKASAQIDPALGPIDPLAPDASQTTQKPASVSSTPPEQKPTIQEQKNPFLDLPVPAGQTNEKPAVPEMVQKPLTEAKSGEGEGAKKAETGEKKALEQTHDVPTPLPQKSAENPPLSSEKDSSRKISSGEAFAEAPAAVKVQLQQPERTKEALTSQSGQATKPADVVSPNPHENIVREVGEKAQSAQPQAQATAQVPATGPLKDVPSIQEVVRSRIESEVTQYPELSSKWGNLLSFLDGALAEQKSREIVKSLKTLLEVLLPALPKDRKESYLAQLEILHKDVIHMIAVNGANIDDYLAIASVLSDQLKLIIDHASSDISPIAGKKPEDKVQVHPPAPSAIQPSPVIPDKKPPTITPLPGGHGKKHHKGYKG